MFDILILENICYLEDLAKRACNFICGGGSDGSDLTLPILLYKNTFSIVDSFHVFKIHCNAVMLSIHEKLNAKPIRFYVNIKSYLFEMLAKY